MLRTCALVGLVLLGGTGQDQVKPQPSKNLLGNPAFEGAAGADGLPEGWYKWVQADGKYRTEIVDAGRKGKPCLKIEGEGIRGIATSIPIKIDRNKRYVLRGSVKLEGDKDARALIVFNYSHEDKWLGLVDTVKISSKHKGWQTIAKTDRAREVPAASVLSVSCNLEGKGTAYFDELELVAYDAANLPADFDERFGPSNRPAEFAVLARRVGTWEVETTTKPGVWVPDGLKTTADETVDWILGKKFIQGKNKHLPRNVEGMFIETYDAQMEVFRVWHFDSDGNHMRNVVTGRWDPESRALTYEGTDPQQVSMRSTLHFIDADRLEWQGVWRDKSGKALMEIEGKLSRRKSP